MKEIGFLTSDINDVIREIEKRKNCNACKKNVGGGCQCKALVAARTILQNGGSDMVGFSLNGHLQAFQEASEKANKTVDQQCEGQAKSNQTAPVLRSPCHRQRSRR